MSIEWITILIFGSMVLVMFMGLPVAFATGFVGIIFTAIFQGPSAVNIVPTRIFGLMTNYLLDAIPLFILMANILERSGIIEDIYMMVYHWLGWLKGGVATATVAACTMMAAMAGVVGATEVTMGLIALPQMLNRKYDKLMALGVHPRRRHAGDPDPPQRHADRLRDGGQLLHRPALRRRLPAGLPPGGALTSSTSRSAATSTPRWAPPSPRKSVWTGKASSRWPCRSSRRRS